MNPEPEAQQIPANEALGNQPEEPSAVWNLRLTPALRRSAQRFHNAYLGVQAEDEGEFAQPLNKPLKVRLIYHGPLHGTRTAELIQMIGAASAANLMADDKRSRRLFQRLKSLREEVVKVKERQIEGAGNPQWDELLQRTQAAQLKDEALGGPPYINYDPTVTGGIPDFMAIWRERVRYTDRLTELETEHASLREAFVRLKREPSGGIGAISCLVPPPVAIDQTNVEVDVGVGDFLGGPLAAQVSLFGRSVGRTESVSLAPRWRELALTYCELHYDSNLLDFVLVGNGDGWECSCESDARRTLARAQGHLLKFLKAACNPPVMAESTSTAEPTKVEQPVDQPPVQHHVEVLANVVPEAESTAAVSKTKNTRAKTLKVKPPIAEKSALKIVRVERTGKSGSPLRLVVDGVPLHRNAVAAEKALLAACILSKKHTRVKLLKTEDLKQLVLTDQELKDLNLKGFPQTRDNLKRSLSAQGIILDFQDGTQRFRLLNAKFQTSLSVQVIKAALDRLKAEKPIQRAKKKKPNS